MYASSCNSSPKNGVLEDTSSVQGHTFLSDDYVPTTLDDGKEEVVETHRRQSSTREDVPVPVSQQSVRQEVHNDSTFQDSVSHQDGNKGNNVDDNEAPFGGDRPYSILGELGEGAFGTTTLVMDERNSEVYVLKRIICESVEQANEALDEARTLSKFDKSDHIVNLHDFFLDVRLKSRILSVVW